MTKRLIALLLALAPLAAAETLRSKDGQLQVTLPAGWIEAPADSPMRHNQASPDTKLFLKSPDQILFALLLREPKEDLTAKTLDDYAERILGLLHERAPGRTFDPLRHVKVGTRDTLRLVSHDERQGVRMVHLTTFVEAPHHWLQVACWATPSHLEALERDCAALLRTVEMVPSPH